MANTGPMLNQHYTNATTASTSTLTRNKLHCKECEVYFDSAKSLEVHLQYHKENLMSKWASQQNGDETNNNKIKNREFFNTIVAAPADSSDAKKSPDYRASPMNSANSTQINTSNNSSFGHPPTPQSYNTPSPFNADTINYSPNFASYHKERATSPAGFFPGVQYDGYNQYVEQQQNFVDYHQRFMGQNYRYHPYHQLVTSSSSPGFAANANTNPNSNIAAQNPQPTPSPSPKQCDKCGFFCETPAQLLEHLHNFHQFDRPFYEPKVKDEPQSEILDLDSQKVHVHIYPDEQDTTTLKREIPATMSMNGLTGSNPSNHSVTSMLSWTDQRMDRNQYTAIKQEFTGSSNQGEFLSNNGSNVSTTTQDVAQSPDQHPYRPFENISSIQTGNPSPVISSTQATTLTNAQVLVPAIPKGANWKSNEARRPKTYNCTACNKWFTSSGHLKRHYNTTLHKNAVKSSGAPDPATLPISVHHHPTRDPNYPHGRQKHVRNQPEIARAEEPSQESEESYDNRMLQPPCGPYDRHHSPGLSSQGSQISSSDQTAHVTNGNSLGNLTNLSTADSPNGMAGSSDPLRGLQQPEDMLAPQLPPFNLLNPMAMNQSGLIYPGVASSHTMTYPNELSPHVTQTTAGTINNRPLPASNSPTTTGERPVDERAHVPLPSFQQFTTYLLNGYDMIAPSNVGGLGPATDAYHPDINQLNDDTNTMEFETDYILADYASESSQNHVQHVDDDDETYDNESMPYPIKLDDTGDDKLIIDESPTPITKIFPRLIEMKVEGVDDMATTKVDLEMSSPLITSTGSPRSGKYSKRKTIANPGPHRCLVCDKTFNKICYLTQHNKTFHCGDKPFKCNRCGKRFSDEVTYQEHTTKHAGEKPHKCEQCPKQFNHKTDLRRHMCLHSGTKPYTCDACGKGFIRKDHMVKHGETHLRKQKTLVAQHSLSLSSSNGHVSDI